MSLVRDASGVGCRDRAVAVVAEADGVADLLRVQRFSVQQGLGERFELVAVRGQQEVGVAMARLALWPPRPERRSSPRHS